MNSTGRGFVVFASFRAENQGECFVHYSLESSGITKNCQMQQGP